MGYWLKRFDKLPPNVCRLIARMPHMAKAAALTTEQISKRSGLSKQTVLKISKLKSWATISLQDIERFEMGCGIVPGSEAKHRFYVKRSFRDSSTPLFHIQRLRKMKKDPRLEKFLVDLMLPKE